MVSKWELLGKISASTYRVKVLEELNKSPKTPKQLSKLTNIGMSHISRTLKELEKLGLVKCLTPEIRKSKFYSITDIGIKVLKDMEISKKSI
jgi:DNA-binding MarR family transcriptional regulator